MQPLVARKLGRSLGMECVPDSVRMYIRIFMVPGKQEFIGRIMDHGWIENTTYNPSRLQTCMGRWNAFLYYVVLDPKCVCVYAISVFLPVAV